MSDERKPTSSGNGTTFGYYVEARNVGWKGGARPMVGCTHIGEDWTRIAVERVPHGVESGLWCKVAETVSTMVSYPAAQALIAAAAAGQMLNGIGLEFRLVRAKLVYSWTIEDVKAGETVSFRDRESQEFPHV